MTRWLLLLATLLLASEAFGQALVLPCYYVSPNECQRISIATPLPVLATVSASVAVDTITSNTQAKVTIAMTNTYQQALASNASRKGCLIQNNGANAAYVFFGTAPADTTTSFKLTTGQALACAVGGIATLGTAINVTGTAGDVLVVSSQ